MLEMILGRRRRAAGPRVARAAAPAASLLLGGCSVAPADAAAWGFAGLALLAAAGTAYALGALRARGRHERELRESRACLRQLAQLREDWVWETDAEHRVVAWQGPGQAAVASSALLAAPAMAALLRAEQAFAGLRLRSPTAQDGHHAWDVRGVPRHDDLGRFSGFVGRARPTDAEERLGAAAAALGPALASHAGPMCLAAEAGAGWQLIEANAAAQALGTGLHPGATLDEALAALPPVLREALQPLLQGSTTPVLAAGWHAEPLGAAGARALLLTRQSAAGEPAGGGSTAESDNFSFTVTHDLRAPIRVVEGFTRIVKEDYGRLLDRVGNDHLDRVLGAAARMNLMIDALLTLARLSTQPLARQPVNLSQLAGYVIDDLRRGAPEREADIDIEPGLATQGDPTLLRLVLENLLGNAWKYSARCTRAQISLRAVAHGGRTAYVVRDNGAGFDMRSADRLFGLFQRLHSASEFAGHGVGLASVRRIVRRHGGDIWAEAEPGRGAAFHFTLAG
jgi:signal transduction histidine kinase/PAS domain-containing protein